MSLVDRIHAEHVERQQRFAKRAVPDTGINMRNGRVVHPPKVIPIMAFDEVDSFVPVRSVSYREEYGPVDPVTKAFGPIVCEREPIEKRIMAASVQKVVCRHYGVSRAEVCSQRRHAHLVRARQVGMYLCKILTVQSYPMIGLLYGGKDHTTCLWAYRKIAHLRTIDQELSDTLDMLADEIRSAA